MALMWSALSCSQARKATGFLASQPAPKPVPHMPVPPHWPEPFQMPPPHQLPPPAPPPIIPGGVGAVAAGEAGAAMAAGTSTAIERARAARAVSAVVTPRRFMRVSFRSLAAREVSVEESGLVYS